MPLQGIDQGSSPCSSIMQKNDLIEIKWVDIVTESKWLSEQKAAEFLPVPCKCVGYFLNETEDVIRLSHTIGLEEKGERDITVIPKGVVKNIRRLINEPTTN